MSGDYRVITSACGQRICPHCAERLALDFAERTELWMRGTSPRSWRLITLTLSASRAPLSEQIKRLRASFRRLRQQRIWQRTQDYGRAHIEVTYNAQTDAWHPHLHVIAKGRYIPQRSLSRAWLRATDDSYVVDVRQINSPAQAAKYVTKYVAKPTSVDGETFPLERAVELVESGNKARWIIAYGDGPPFPEPPPAEVEIGTWVQVGFLEDFYNASQCGDRYATVVLARVSITACAKAQARDGPEPVSQLELF